MLSPALSSFSTVTNFVVQYFLKNSFVFNIFLGNYPASCNFERSICSWTQDKLDKFDWTRANGHTSTYGTGPSRDHTRGTASGYYMFIESSSPRRRGDKARLLSPLFRAVPPNSNSCSVSKMVSWQILFWWQILLPVNVISISLGNVQSHDCYILSYTEHKSRQL